MTAHAMQVSTNSCTTQTMTIIAIYEFEGYLQADKNPFASHSNYEPELQYSPSLDNLRDPKIKSPLALCSVASRYSPADIPHSPFRQLVFRMAVVIAILSILLIEEKHNFLLSVRHCSIALLYTNGHSNKKVVTKTIDNKYIYLLSMVTCIYYLC